MKIKWLVILFIFFLGIIFLSLWITQQGQKTVSLLENKNPIVEQVESSAGSTYLLPVRPALIAVLPSGKSGITIIKAPGIESEEKSIPVSKIADKSTNNIVSQNALLNTQAAKSLPAGITKIGKQPTHKEAQEMNSRGIVLY